MYCQITIDENMHQMKQTALVFKLIPMNILVESVDQGIIIEDDVRLGVNIIMHKGFNW